MFEKGIDKNKRRMSRRELLKKAFPGVAALGIAGAGITAKEMIEKNKEEIEELKKENEELKKENEELKNKNQELIKENHTLENILKKAKEENNIKTMKVIATAYTAGPKSTNKRPGDIDYGIAYSGWKVDKGVIAVDPNVIELGTIVYVPGYGYALALDTGSAIKGNKIDLFFDNEKEESAWGKREVEIKIIGKIENFRIITKLIREGKF